MPLSSLSITRRGAPSEPWGAFGYSGPGTGTFQAILKLPTSFLEDSALQHLRTCECPLTSHLKRSTGVSRTFSLLCTLHRVNINLGFTKSFWKLGLASLNCAV